MLQSRGYEVIDDLIDHDILKLLQINCQLHLINGHMNTGDDQVKGARYMYGSVLFDSVLLFYKNKLSQICSKDLLPTYSYLRTYYRGSTLERHKDKSACEFSVTTPIDYKSNNIWPIWLEDLNGERIPVLLKCGQALIYRGMDVPHWRDEFEGEYQTQVFLHYVDANGPHRNRKYNGRMVLGAP